MKNFNIIWVLLKIRFLGGGSFAKKQYIGGELPKKEWGVWTASRFKGGGLGKEEGWCF